MSENNQNLPERPQFAQPDKALWSPNKKGPIGRALAPVAGFGVTFATLFKKPVTEQYLPHKPEQKTPTRPRYHGMHRLNRYADGLEKCIGCELCAWACPADAIYVEAASNQLGQQFSPGERYGRVYQINYLRCIFCSYCIQACPTRALTMSNEYEIADQTRESLIYEKQDLLVPLAQGMLATPHPMVSGTTDADYYKGVITGPTADQVAWVLENRPEDPTIDSAKVVEVEIEEAKH